MKHYFLYYLSFLILGWFDMPAGSLVLLILWQQLGLLLWKSEITSEKQKIIFLHSLLLIPLFLFLGSITAFTTIHFSENNYLPLLFSSTLYLILSFMLITFSHSIFFDIGQFKNLNDLILNLLKTLKIRKIYYFKCTFIFILTHVAASLIFKTEYSLVLSFTISQFMGKTYLLQNY